jgi:hypothetical protein
MRSQIEIGGYNYVAPDGAGLAGAGAKADFPPRAFGFGQEGTLAAAAEFANMNWKMNL